MSPKQWHIGNTTFSSVPDSARHRFNISVELLINGSRVRVGLVTAKIFRLLLNNYNNGSLSADNIAKSVGTTANMVRGKAISQIRSILRIHHTGITIAKDKNGYYITLLHR